MKSAIPSDLLKLLRHEVALITVKTARAGLHPLGFGKAVWTLSASSFGFTRAFGASQTLLDAATHVSVGYLRQNAK